MFNGNLTQSTAYPGDDEDPQVTDTLSDWRDRRVATEEGVGSGGDDPIDFEELDNEGNVVAQKEFDGVSVTITVDSDGNPEEPDSSDLTAETTTSTDSEGDDDSDDTLSVDPTTGATSAGESGHDYYDADGNPIASESPSGVWTKTTYDDDGQVKAVYTTDGAGGDTESIDGDVVFSQQEYQYDEDGNTILTTTRTRNADADSDDTGALDDSNSTVTYVGDWYDADDNLTDEVNFGDNGGTALTSRPDTVPTASATILVTHTDYDDDGNVADTIDTSGIEMKYTYDAAGELKQEIDNYLPDVNSGNPTDSANITTNFTYDGNGNFKTEDQLAPDGETHEETEYIYGTGVNADTVVKTENPDPVTGDASTSSLEDETETLDNFGTPQTETDPDGTVHTYTYDDLGRLKLDVLTTLGSDNDGLIRAVGYSYTDSGQPFQTTNYSDTDATDIVSQTQNVYDGYGNLTGQYVSQDGAVDTDTTPEETVTPNADGEDSGTTDPFGATTSNTYAGGVLTQTNQTGHDIAAQYNYDPATGNLTSLKLYPSGTIGSGTPETTTWTYDPASGQLKNKTYADGTQDSYTYNSNQQLESLTRPGETINYTYNPDKTISSSTATDTITDTTVTDSSGYYSNGQLSSVGQSTTQESTTTTATNNFTYTDQGNVETETQAAGVTVEYTYYDDDSDNPGAVESVKLVQDGETVSETDYTYDSSQRLETMTVNGQTVTFGYTTGKNTLASITGGDASTALTYDPDTGKLASINTTTDDEDASANVFSAGYTYNDNNQRETQTVSQTNADASTTDQNYTYGYDNENHLETVTDTDTDETLDDYTYDSTGNRTDSAFAAQYGTPTSMNEYSSITYNARGDETDDGVNAYTWNASDQLTSVTAHDNSIKVTFQYDGQGRCIQKDVYSWEDGKLRIVREVVDEEWEGMEGEGYGPIYERRLEQEQELTEHLIEQEAE